MTIVHLNGVINTRKSAGTGHHPESALPMRDALMLRPPLTLPAASLKSTTRNMWCGSWEEDRSVAFFSAPDEGEDTRQALRTGMPRFVWHLPITLTCAADGG
ncbi:hypothetical protein IMZ48_42325 [Candidatus Bathyarchaeota archaeon]|nr:hypothetical protein [Candidatus Bathyarchaeota archaeon]